MRGRARDEPAEKEDQDLRDDADGDRETDRDRPEDGKPAMP